MTVRAVKGREDPLVTMHFQDMAASKIPTPREQRRMMFQVAQARIRFRRALLMWVPDLILWLEVKFQTLHHESGDFTRVIEVLKSKGRTEEEIRARCEDVLNKIGVATRHWAEYRRGRSLVVRRKARKWKARLVRLVEMLSPNTEMLLKQSETWLARNKDRPIAKRLEAAYQRWQDAREALIRANPRLVFNIARRWDSYGLEYVDRIQSCYIGLIRAVDLIDPWLGYTFGTYATWWIRQAGQRDAQEKGTTIRVPCHVVGELWRVRNNEERLFVRGVTKPTLKQLSKGTDLDAGTIKAACQVLTPMASVGRKFNDGSDRERLQLEAPDKSPFQNLALKQIKEDIDKVLISIEPRKLLVIVLRFGLRGNRPMSLEESGKILGVSKERIRQLESQALRQLKCRFERLHTQELLDN